MDYSEREALHGRLAMAASMALKAPCTWDANGLHLEWDTLRAFLSSFEYDVTLAAYLHTVAVTDKQLRELGVDFYELTEAVQSSTTITTSRDSL